MKYARLVLILMMVFVAGFFVHMFLNSSVINVTWHGVEIDHSAVPFPHNYDPERLGDDQYGYQFVVMHDDTYEKELDYVQIVGNSEDYSEPTEGHIYQQCDGDMCSLNPALNDPKDLTLFYAPEAEIRPEYAEALAALAKNIYHEARDQSVKGQKAIAEVTFNRVKDPRWPNDLAQVVYQSEQFSWTIDKKGDPVAEEKIMAAITDLSRKLMLGQEKTNGITKGANHYYATELIDPPAWADPRKKTTGLEDHEFYRL